MEKETKLTTLDDNQNIFASHVVNSCKRHMGAAFFLAGLVEETAELMEAMNEKFHNKEEMKSDIISELGDVLWYANAIVESLPGGKMHEANTNSDVKVNLEISECNVSMPNMPCLPLLLVGKVCGAVKKYLRGDKHWTIMRQRIEPALNASVSTMVQLTVSCLNQGSTSFDQVLNEAMKANISKVEARLRLNTIRGDGKRENLDQIEKAC